MGTPVLNQKSGDWLHRNGACWETEFVDSVVPLCIAAELLLETGVFWDVGFVAPVVHC